MKLINKLLCMSIVLFVTVQSTTGQNRVFCLSDNQFVYTIDSSLMMEYDQLRDIENTYLLIPKISPVWDSNGTISDNTPVWDPTYHPIYEVTWMESFIAIRQDLIWSDLKIWFKKEGTGQTRIIRIVNYGYER